MKIARVTQRRFALVCAVVLVVLVVVTALRESDFFAAAQNVPAPVQEKPAPKDDKKQKVAKAKPVPAPQQQKKVAPSPVANYSYIAQPGDSYTGFARQAVNAYANKHGLTLTSQQQLEAEVALTNNAGAPLLEVDQKVVIAVADVAKVAGGKAVATKAPKVEAKAPVAQKQTPVEAADVRVVAVAGDSYTVLARAAINQYLVKAKVSLTPAQRVAAESFVVTQAGSPQVEVNQVVTFDTATLKQAIERATELTANELAAWQLYAAHVQFK